MSTVTPTALILFWWIAQNLYLKHQSLSHQLQHLSNTHWACRLHTVDAVCSTFDAILTSLQSIMDGSHKVKASGIYMQIYSFKFLTTLILFWKIMSCIKGLSDQLQSTHNNMAKAAGLVTATI